MAPLCELLSYVVGGFNPPSITTRGDSSNLPTILIRDVGHKLPKSGFHSKRGRARFLLSVIKTVVAVVKMKLDRKG